MWGQRIYFKNNEYDTSALAKYCKIKDDIYDK